MRGALSQTSRFTRRYREPADCLGLRRWQEAAHVRLRRPLTAAGRHHSPPPLKGAFLPGAPPPAGPARPGCGEAARTGVAEARTPKTHRNTMAATGRKDHANARRASYRTYGGPRGSSRARPEAAAAAPSSGPSLCRRPRASQTQPAGTPALLPVPAARSVGASPAQPRVLLL